MSFVAMIPMIPTFKDQGGRGLSFAAHEPFGDMRLTLTKTTPFLLPHVTDWMEGGLDPWTAASRTLK